MNTDIVVSYQNGGSFAFIIKCECRSQATDENIISAVERFYKRLWGEAKAKMVPTIVQGYTNIHVEIPGETLRLTWSFAPSLEILSNQQI